MRNPPTQTEHIAESILPQFDDPLKTRYISLRSCGFTIRESAVLVPIHESTIRKWRMWDELFRSVETNIKEYQAEFQRQHLTLEFTRNYAMVLHKDMQVLKKAVFVPDEMTKDDTAYLHKLRGHYTPQQLQLIQGGPSDNGDSGSWKELMIRLSRVTEEVTIERR